MVEVFKRGALINRVCEVLKRDYVALLGQRGSGIQTFISILANETPLVPHMKIISIPLPESKWDEKYFNELFLERLKTAIGDVPPEETLSNEVIQEVEKHREYPADYRLRIALDVLGRKTTADPLVIILQSMVQAPEEPLKGLLLLLRDYHNQRNMPKQAGKKLRFLIPGDQRLWLLCYQRSHTYLHESPFNIAKRIFLEGLSYEELEELDQSASIEAAVSMHNLTNGVPSLVKKAIELPHIPDDLSPFFALLENYWNSLSEGAKQTLKRLAENPQNAPAFYTDSECPQVPVVESPWIEAFWKGFLRVDSQELTWRSLIHQAFVINRMQVKKDASQRALLKVDLLERSLRLEKALKQGNESSSKYLAEALSLTVQTQGTVLAPILEMLWREEEKTAILQKVSQVANNSDKGWVKELEEKTHEDSTSINKLLIDAAVWEYRRSLGDFDVFLCHNGNDKPLVKAMAEKLLEQGILPWLDEWELRPGFPWQPALEGQIKHIKAAAVFAGKSGIGPWQDMELRGFLQQFVDRQCPVIPVILPDGDKVPELPLFLQNMTWVDFRKQDPNPMERLIWGITGKHATH